MSQYPSRQAFDGNGSHRDRTLGPTDGRIPSSQMTSMRLHPAVADSSNANSDLSARNLPLAPELRLPNVDMSALAGVTSEQVALIAQLFQSGALQIPTAFAIATKSAPSSPPNSSTTNYQAPPLSEHVNGSQGNTRSKHSLAHDLHHDPTSGMYDDEEDGEVISGQSSEEAGHTVVGKHTKPSSQTGISLENKRSAAEEFLREMVRAGFSYDQLANHVRNRTHLSHMFSNLGLSQGSNHVSLREVPAKEQKSPNSVSHVSAVISEQRQRPVQKRQAATATKVVNRADYLARLQAAKNKKSEASPQTSTPPAVSLPRPAVPISAPKAIPNHQMSAATKAEKDKLLRERLAAVKAEHAAKQAAKQQRLAVSLSNDIVPRMSFASGNTTLQLNVGPAHEEQYMITTGIRKTPENTNTTANELDITSREKKQPMENLNGESPATGLPGLFMRTLSARNMAPNDRSSIMNLDRTTSSVEPTLTALHTPPRPAVSPTASSTPGKGLINTRKRPVATDFDEDAIAIKPAKRSFGQSRGTSEDESMIIENSDNEDDGNELREKSSQPQYSTRSFRESGPLRDFPPRQDLQAVLRKPLVSGAATPSGADYQRVVQDIEEMNRKIAFLEKKKSAMRAISHSRDSATATPLSSRASTLLETDMSIRDDSASNPLASKFVVVSTNQTQSLSPKSEAHLTSEEHRQVSEPHDESRDGSQEPANEFGASEHTYMADVGGNAIASDLPGVSPQDDGTQSEVLRTKDVSPVANVHSVVDDELSDESISNFYSSTSPAANKQIEQITDNATVRASITLTDPKSPSLVRSATPVSEHPIRTAVTEDLVLGGVNVMTDVQESFPGTMTETGLVPWNNREPSAPNARNESDVENTDANDSSIDSSSADTASQISSSGAEEDYEPRDISQDDKQQEFILDGPQRITHVSSDTNSTSVSGSIAIQHSHNSSIQQGAFSSLAVASPPEQVTFPSQVENSGYVSPLTKFKDFRFHPLYLELVAGGYRSLTYNHQIDPHEPICQYEVVGGICNDKECPGQHFASMALTDTELLKRLCTDNIPVRDSDERARWDAGLSALIKSLRASNQGNDVELAAAKIVQFRREFLGDPSRVLNLT